MKPFLFLFGIFNFLLLMYCNENPSTTGTEIENERFTAMVKLPDGSPAVSATVTILPVDYVPKLSKETTKELRRITDSKGYVDLSGLAEGCYNIYAERDTLTAFADSVYLTSNGLDKTGLKLSSSGHITGFVAIQPNHDSRIVTVQVLGTQLYANADQNGMFELPRIAYGEYNIRLIANETGYNPTFKTINVTRSGKDTIRDTLEIFYTGIPVVENIKASYEKSKGIVVTWSPVIYPNLYDYLIYRDTANSVEMSQTPFASASDTIFIDSTMQSKAGTFKYIYRVAVRNNSMDKGKTYKTVNVTAVSEYRCTITTNPNFIEGLPNEKIKIVASISSYPVAVKSVVWNFRFSDSILQRHTLAVAANDVIDTLVYTIPNQLFQYISCSALDSRGNCLITDSIGGTIDTLSRDSLYHDTLRHDTLRYDTLRYDTLHYDTLRYDTLRYDTLHYDTLHYDTIDTVSYHLENRTDNEFFLKEDDDKLISEVLLVDMALRKELLL
jgi:hypothetical protein